jgi:hypothetical protein
MKKYFAAMMMAGLVALSSCVQPMMNQQEILKTDDSVQEVLISKDQIEFSPVFGVEFNTLKLYFSRGSGVTGTITVEIRTADGSQVITSSTRTASSLASSSGWNTFYFNTVYLTPLNKYRINVFRSDAHNNLTGNTIFWHSSSGTTNPYPQGINDVYPGWNLDYSFISYSSGYTDQSQTLTSYGFAVGNTVSRWQEFVPDRVKTSLTRVDLFLDTGVNVAGSIKVQIRNSDGSQILWENTIDAASYLIKGFTWNAFQISGLKLYKGDKYRIYVMRTTPHNFSAGDYIFWRTSGSGDTYPYGSNNQTGWVLDYAFRTYSNSVLDEQQTNTSYGFGLNHTAWYWQEFVHLN